MTNEWEKVVKVLKEEIIKNRREIKSAIEASESKLLLKIEELNHRVTNLEIENSNLTNKIEALEVVTKKNNIIIFGLENSEESSPSSVCRELKNLLDVEVHVSDLNNAYRLRTQGKNPLKVEFVSYLKKLEVLKHCKNLKGSGVAISNDLTYKQRCHNKILRNHLNKAREDSSVKSYIKGNKLYINNRAYTVEELEDKENSITEERKISSAPSTPSIRNIEQELFETSGQKGKLPEDKSVSNISTAEESNETKVEKNDKNTPVKVSLQKKFTKTTVGPQKERTKSLRSGSVTSGRD